MSKKIISNIIKYFMLLIIYVILLTAVCYIPKDYIYANAVKSSEELLVLGEKTVIELVNKQVVLFNFTDAIMLNTIYSIDEEKPFESAMLARRNYIKGKTDKIYKDTNPPGEETNGSANYTSETYQTKELYETVNGRNTYDCIEYARYWHGYMVILRPLLLLFDYNQITIIASIVFITITTVFLYLLKIELRIKTAIAFFISFILTDVFICSISLNAIIPFYIGIITGIYFLIRKDRSKSVNFAFLIVGSLTSFFDLLTTPIVTLALPLIVKTLLDIKEEKNSIKDMICNVIFWGMGYATTMLFKWFLTDIFLNREVISTSIKQLLYRMGNDADGIKYTLLLTIQNNVYFLGNIYFYIIVILLSITCGIGIAKKNNINRDSVSILLISIIPICWYVFLKNHSAVHAFFTYRNFLIIIICILILFFNNINFNNLRYRISRHKQKYFKIQSEEEIESETND